MGVALKASLGVTVGLVVTSQVPDDQGLVATGGKEHVGAVDDAIAISTHAFFFSPRLRAFAGARLDGECLLLKRGSQAGNPAIVALKGSAKDELLSHDQGLATKKRTLKRGGEWRSKTTDRLSISSLERWPLSILLRKNDEQSVSALVRGLCPSNSRLSEFLRTLPHRLPETQ